MSGVLSSVGASPVRTAVAGLAVAALLVARDRRSAAFVLIVLTVVHLLDRLGKAAVDRPRPLTPQHGHALPVPVLAALIVGLIAAGSVVLIRRARPAVLIVPLSLALAVAVDWMVRLVPVAQGSDSFPSGHASNSMALALSLVMVRRPGRWWAVGCSLGLGLAVLIGVSRVTLGFHRASDVIAGWVLAVLVVVALRPVFGVPPVRRTDLGTDARLAPSS